MKHSSFIAFCLLLTVTAGANNVILSDISVVNNVGNTGKVVKFDVSWENSWHTASPGNWDGVWIFFKLKDVNGSWYHLRFNGNNITMPVGVSYQLGNNGADVGIGIFLYRSDLGTGTFTIDNARAGIESYPGTFDIRGFAIEMVYIPQGSFYVGDGSGESTTYHIASSSTDPFQITGNGSVTEMGTSGSVLYDPRAENYSGNLAGFPTGYHAFWMMKYELSQGGYRDFLNTLTYNQQRNRFDSATAPTAAIGTSIADALSNTPLQRRQFIEIEVPGNAGTNTPAIVGCDADNDNVFNEPSDGEWITVSMLTWPDVAAYLDWAGLRPMTELEFEKACRGTLQPVVREFAWGTDEIAVTSYTVINGGFANESISNMSLVGGNAMYNQSGPKLVRGGIFANGTSSRISSGASYYGAMELSGSNHEMCVGTSHVAGRSYTGKNGDGVLTTSGNANENYWPGVNGANGEDNPAGAYSGGTGVSSDGGLLQRGGAVFHPYSVALEVSNRSVPTGGETIITNGSTRTNYAIRGVRAAN